MITLTDVKNNTILQELIRAANHYLEVKGYTEHGLRHVGYVSETSGNILKMLGFDDRTIELARIAGWIHDVGNSINRVNHGITGATLLFPILLNMGMEVSEVMQITTAIGNHEEENGIPVNPICSALIIADKSDAHKTRVRKNKYDPDDIHDRVNYSIRSNRVVVDRENRIIRMEFEMDDTSSLMEYFEIYLSRMMISEKAAKFLNCSFELVINGVLMNNHFDFKKSQSEKEVSVK